MKRGILSLLTLIILIFLTFNACTSANENTSSNSIKQEEVYVPASAKVKPSDEESDCISCSEDGACNPAFQTFKKMYPEVSSYECCKRRNVRDRWCEFIFQIGNQIYEVEFAENGSWLETEEEHIPLESVPPYILKDIQSRFPSAKIEECEREFNKSGTYYEIDLLFSDGGSAEFYYSDKGDFLQGYNRYEDGENTSEYK